MANGYENILEYPWYLSMDVVTAELAHHSGLHFALRGVWGIHHYGYESGHVERIKMKRLMPSQILKC